MKYKELGELINSNLEVSICKFAKDVGVSRMTIYNILNGKCLPTLATIKKICKYFNVDYRNYI